MVPTCQLKNRGEQIAIANASYMATSVVYLKFRKYNGNTISYPDISMKTKLAVCAALLFAQGAFAQTTCQTVGNNRYCNNVSGTSSVTTHSGNSSYTNYSDGRSSSSMQVGNSRYTQNSDGISGSTLRVGDTQYTNRSDGTTTTTRQVGNSTYISDSKGNTVTCQTVGNQRYCN